MATERPEDAQDERSEQTERDLSEERKTEEGATVEEESEQSFPASDPPAY